MGGVIAKLVAFFVFCQPCHHFELAYDSVGSVPFQSEQMPSLFYSLRPDGLTMMVNRGPPLTGPSLDLELCLSLCVRKNFPVI